MAVYNNALAARPHSPALRETDLDLELNIMNMTLGRRVADRQLDRRWMPEGWAPMPDGPWERELQAVGRIPGLLRMVYDDEFGQPEAGGE